MYNLPDFMVLPPGIQNAGAPGAAGINDIVPEFYRSKFDSQWLLTVRTLKTVGFLSRLAIIILANDCGWKAVMRSARPEMLGVHQQCDSDIFRSFRARAMTAN
jgi:hypothetical protein